MDHPEAIAMKAAERYVLGDLSVSEVEEFERHFFDCPQCSEELRLLSVLQENARAVFVEQTPGPQTIAVSETIPVPLKPVREEPVEAWWRAWLSPARLAPALAAIVVALLVGYQTGKHGSTDAPQSISSFPLYAASRGDETVVSPPAGAQFYSVYMDRTWDQDEASYQATLKAEASGAVKYSIRVGAVAQGQSVQVLIPAQALEPGRYVLTISGVDGKELSRYPFTLRFH